MAVNGDSPDPESAEQQEPDPRDPSGFLSSIIGSPVTVKLNSGIIYKGNLQSVDGYMNIAIERCEEIVQGQVVRSWGDCFVRGNNVTFISADKETADRQAAEKAAAEAMAKGVDT